MAHNISNVYYLVLHRKHLLTSGLNITLGEAAEVKTSYLVCADSQLPLPGLSVSLQQCITHLENLLHDSILSQVITALQNNKK